jgi:hypothetical protein
LARTKNPGILELVGPMNPNQRAGKPSDPGSWYPKLPDGSVICWPRNQSGEDDAYYITNAFNWSNVVRVGSCQYVTQSPVVIGSGQVLAGLQPYQQSCVALSRGFGAAITPGDSFAQPAGWPTGFNAAIAFIHRNGSANTPVNRPTVRDLMIDLSQLPDGTVCDGISGWGAVNAAAISGVGIYATPHRMISAFNNKNFKRDNFPDGWMLSDIACQYNPRSTAALDGVYGTFADAYLRNVHVQAQTPIGGTGSPSGDGFYLTGGSNVALEHCRADLMGGYGFTIDVSWGRSQGGFYDCVTMTDCHTQRNNRDGCRIVNFSNPNAPRAPVKMSNCTFDGDGVNSGKGGGNFAGVSCWGEVTLLASNVSVFVGTVDVSGGCPEYAMRTRTNNGGDPVLVDWTGGFLGGTTANASLSGAPVLDGGSTHVLSYSAHGYVGTWHNSGSEVPCLFQHNPR